MNEMPNSKPCRKDLLMQIGHASFAVDDVKLYLDTHPRDQEALDFFYEYNKKRNQLLKEDLTSLRLVFSSVSLSLRDRLFSVCLGLMIMARHR